MIRSDGTIVTVSAGHSRIHIKSYDAEGDLVGVLYTRPESSRSRRWGASCKHPECDGSFVTVAGTRRDAAEQLSVHYRNRHDTELRLY